MILLRFTISSFFITLLTVSMLIGLFHFLLTREKSHHLFRVDFLSIILICILLRILLPIEFPFTFTIASHHIMTFLYDVLLYNITSGIRILDLLLAIWGIGIVIQAYRHLSKMRSLHTFVSYIEKNAVHQRLSKYLAHPKDVDLYFSDMMSSPMVIGIKNAVYFPSSLYSDKEINYILRHELQHIRQKDLWIKQLINMLIILYWWFPPVYRLRKQIDLYLEMKADNAVIQSMSREECMEYIQIILDVQKRQVKKASIDHKLSACFIDDGALSLKHRIDFLLKGGPKRRTSILLLSIALTIPFLSNSVIIEPSYLNDPQTEDTYSQDMIDDSYIIKHKDGSYTIVIQEEEYTLDELPISSDIPIIEE